MKKQNAENHIRYYYPHHFVFYPMVLGLAGLSFNAWLRSYKLDAEFLFLGAGFIIIAWLSFMMRQHYALTNQNRLIRLEMRLRYYQLTSKRLEIYEDRLSFSQIAALRFASDEELPALIEETLSQNLPPAKIKHSIQNWLPDHMRV